MDDLDPGARRALDRFDRQLTEAKRAYDVALLFLVPYVRDAARKGDTLAAHLLEEYENARARMITETMEAQELLLE
jgi:hypothetical protein